MGEIAGTPVIYPVIMAGGRGTRFWPESRRGIPKQFLPIAGDQPMITRTWERIADMADPDRCYILTGERYLDAVRRCLPAVPVDNILTEPVGRNTAPAIAWVSRLIMDRDPRGVAAVLASDHVIGPVEEFRSTMAMAARLAHERGDIVTIGIPPDRPETGYGYLEMGERLGSRDGMDFFTVDRFVEKPDPAAAKAYVAAGNYLWNSGMFVFPVSRIMAEFASLQPEIHALADMLVESGNSPETVRRVFPQMPNISIDYAVMEKTRGIIGIPAPFTWTDIGSWESLADFLPGDADGNRMVGDHLLHRCTGTMAHGRKRLIVGVGLEDTIIVETDDAILVCRKQDAQRVGDIVKILEDNERFSKLV